MGNGVGKLTGCLTGGDGVRRLRDTAVLVSDPTEDLGHSFYYVRPDPLRLSSSKVHSDEATTFRSISGAAVSANMNSGPLPSNLESGSSFLDRSFLSGPIERGFLSGPLFSGPLDRSSLHQLQRSYSHGGCASKPESKRRSIIQVIQKAISKTISQGQASIVTPIKGVISVKDHNLASGFEKNNELTVSSLNLSSENSFMEDDESVQSQNLQWAQGKAGEDRVHVVVSEEHGWVFVGIYDGFNGPDAPDFLLSNLYQNVHKELKGLLWDDKFDPTVSNPTLQSNNPTSNVESQGNEHLPPVPQENSENGRRRKGKIHSRTKKWEESKQRWKYKFDRDRLELNRKLKEQMNSNGSRSFIHLEVLKALSRGLKKTEESFLDIVGLMLDENPELALMGSCVLMMLMKGEDVYVMNVGDSRAVLAQMPELWKQDLEGIKEESLWDIERFNAEESDAIPCLGALQLTFDHSTSVAEEVQRIRSEHPDDACAVTNDRVKGSLRVTRAFGAGYLKQPKWNNALLEMFRVDYVGTCPYVNCRPHLHHHKLGPRDRFLILSSDGLYQYFTNDEAISEAEAFIRRSPEGDPAQHLVEQVLLRAAKKAGMKFHELLEIPQGDRRRYHDDISVIVISLEGRIWRSCV